MPDTDKEVTFSDARSSLHKSMKETSDYVGAIIRLGVLSVFIYFLADRISDYQFMRDGYFLSLGFFIIILTVTWIALAIKIFLFTLLNVGKVLLPVKMIEKMEAELPSEIGILGRLRFHAKRSWQLSVIFFAIGLIALAMIHSSIAAFYELADFINR